jgi:hypothetical protein
MRISADEHDIAVDLDDLFAHVYLRDSAKDFVFSLSRGVLDSTSADPDSEIECMVLDPMNESVVSLNCEVNSTSIRAEVPESLPPTLTP